VHNESFKCDEKGVPFQGLTTNASYKSNCHYFSHTLFFNFLSLADKYNYMLRNVQLEVYFVGAVPRCPMPRAYIKYLAQEGLTVSVEYVQHESR
jgi:hypothetical protein